MTDYRELINTWCKAAIEQWFIDQFYSLSERFYFYYKPSTETANGELAISIDAPGDDWKLVSSECVCVSLSKEQAYTKCREWCNHLPILMP